MAVLLEHEVAPIRQILDASNCLDDADFPRFDRYFISRAHLTVSGAISALDRSTDLAGGVERDPGWYPKTWSSDGIRDPGGAALACAPQWYSLANEDVDLVCHRLGCLRNLRGER